jgi:Ni,Fe-hydrogenase I small subunit
MEQVLEQCAAGKMHVDLLVVEGATYLTAPESATWTSGKHLAEWIRAIAPLSDYTVAVGTCASFGGVMACGRNPMGATGLQYYRDEMGGLLGADYRSRAGLPVVNVPGCPAHPDWIIGTLWALRANRLAEADLDRFKRPRAFYGKLAHHACPRNEYYEFKASATAYSQQGCLFENLGCKGTLCESDCNERLWLARTGSCTRGGFPCLSCTSPVFPDRFVPFFETAKIGDIPTSLPLDVPKAWYVGISGLSKLACPERLRRNAVSFKPAWPGTEERPEDGHKDDHV